jgi:hypothetical protein
MSTRSLLTLTPSGSGRRGSGNSSQAWIRGRRPDRSQGARVDASWNRACSRHRCPGAPAASLPWPSSARVASRLPVAVRQPTREAGARAVPNATSRQSPRCFTKSCPRADQIINLLEGPVRGPEMSHEEQLQPGLGANLESRSIEARSRKGQGRHADRPDHRRAGAVVWRWGWLLLRPRRRLGAPHYGGGLWVSC